MSQTALLLVGKIAFLLVLYLFIFGIVRSSTRDMRLAAPTVASQRWRMPGSTSDDEEEADLAAESPAGGGGLWTLAVQKSSCVPVGAAYALPPGSHARVGRVSDMDIFLDDTFVSARHAFFEITDDGLWVEDLRSTNGTTVNGKSIHKPTLLQAGDRVGIGDTVFQVKVR